MKKKWIIGTRGSKLALRQTQIVLQKLQSLYPQYEFIIKTIKTTGDTIRNKPLHLIGGKGLFVKEIEEKLLSKEIDMAVHSVKDLPAELEKHLLLGAVLKREDPRDAFISLTYNRLAEVKDGSTNRHKQPQTKSPDTPSEQYPSGSAYSRKYRNTSEKIEN